MGEELWPEQVSKISQSLGPEYGSTWSRWCNIVRFRHLVGEFHMLFHKIILHSSYTKDRTEELYKEQNGVEGNSSLPSVSTTFATARSLRPSLRSGRIHSHHPKLSMTLPLMHVTRAAGGVQGL
jgi:hypothetical protein